MRLAKAYKAIILTIFSIFFVFNTLSHAGVQPDGSFSHKVDIKLPPGTNNMAPRLSLLYNSNNKNDIAGIGWRLGGLSYIERDKIFKVEYKGDDHYLSQTGRLVKTGNYYHTETETFSRYEAVGSLGDGPDYWIETKPDGTKLYYGQTSDSKIIAKDDSDIVLGAGRWALNKVEDVHGNYYTIEYEEDNGQIYPANIIYTQNNGISTYKSVEFEYEDRNDYYPVYDYKTRIETRKRLKEIIVKTNVVNILGLDLFGNQVRKYVLEYEENSTTNVSRIATVKEYGSSNNFRSVQFEWNETENNFDTALLWADDVGWAGSPYFGFADFNGDGKDDHWYVNIYSSQVMVRLSTGETFGEATLWADNVGWAGSSPYFGFADFNGDGKDDHWYVNASSSQIMVRLSTGETFGEAILWADNGAWAGSPYFGFRDFNGDGKVDNWYVENRVYSRIMVRLSTGDTFGEATLWADNGIWPGDVFFGFADFDGDLITDHWLMQGNLTAWVNGIPWYTYIDDIRVALSNGNSFEPSSLWAETPESAGYPYFGFSDFNGDGKTDHWYVNPGSSQVMVRLSTGDFLEEATLWADNGAWAGHPYFGFRDFNNDGKVDHWYINPSSSQIMVRLSTGSSFSEATLWADNGAWAGHPYFGFGDFNGDGSSDHWYVNAYSSQVMVRLNKNVHENSLIKITDANGGSQTIEYTPISDVPGAIDTSDSVYPYTSNNAPRKLVTKTTVSDGRGSEYSSTYLYKGSRVYKDIPQEMTDLGFAEITVTDQTGKKTVTTYKQDDKWFHHRPLSTIAYDKNNIKLQETVNIYNSNFDSIFTIDGASSTTKYIKLDSTNTTTYVNGTVAYKNSKTYQYDNYGNVTQINDNATGTNEIISNLIFEINTSNWIVNRLIETKISSNSLTMNWEKYIYSNNQLTSKSRYLDTKNKWIKKTYSYDNYGNVTSLTDPLNSSISIEYDSDYKTFPIKIENALGHTIRAEQDPGTGQILFFTDQNSATSRYKYDEFGREIEIIGPDGDWNKRTVYNDTGNANTQYIEIKTNDDSNLGYNYQKLYYDGLKRKYRIVRRACESNNGDLTLNVDFEYNKDGEIIKKSNPYIADNNTAIDAIYYTEFEYDSSGNINKITYPNLTTKDLTYAIDNNYIIETATVTGGRVFKKVYNSRGSLIKRIEPGNVAISYQYNPAGKLLTIISPDNLTIKFYHDSLGRKTKVEDPNIGTMLYDYDDANRLIKQIDAKGQEILITYDIINRVKKIEYSDGAPSVNYTYDDPAVANAISRVTKIDNGHCETRYAYNEHGQPIYKLFTIDSLEFVLRMEYDRTGKMTALTYPDGVKIAREYSDPGYLSSVKWDGHPIVTYGRFEKDSNGDIADFGYSLYRMTGNNIRTKIDFNNQTLRPTRVVSERLIESGPNELLEDLSYGFDIHGNVASITDNKDSIYSQVFSYDELNRIKTASGVYGNLSYTYLNNGNMIKMGDLDLYFNNPNHPYAVSGDSKGNTYTYDANGNMVQRRGKTLTFNARNRLIEISGASGVEQSLIYNHADSKVKTEKSDGTIVYYIAGLFEVTKIPGRDDHFTKYIYGIQNELVAQVTETNSTLVTAGSPRGGILFDSFDFDGIGEAIREYILSLNLSSLNITEYSMILLLLFFIGLLVYNTFVGNDKKAKRKGLPVWIYRSAHGTLFLMVLIIGSIRCDYSMGDITGSKPWDSIDYPASIQATGIPVTGIYFFHPDYTGNVSYVTDRDGAVISRTHYRPYGQIATQNGVDVYRYKYNSHELDGDTGLSYYNARFYDPLIGRFISPDSIIPDITGTQSLNRYSYVEGSPIDLQDRDGHIAVGFILALAAIAIGAGVWNLATNWHADMGFGEGFGYFVAGATGGVVGYTASIGLGPVVGSVVGMTTTIYMNQFLSGGSLEQLDPISFVSNAIGSAIAGALPGSNYYGPMAATALSGAAYETINPSTEFGSSSGGFGAFPSHSAIPNESSYTNSSSGSSNYASSQPNSSHSMAKSFYVHDRNLKIIEEYQDDSYYSHESITARKKENNKRNYDDCAKRANKAAEKANSHLSQANQYRNQMDRATNQFQYDSAYLGYRIEKGNYDRYKRQYDSWKSMADFYAQ